MDPLIRQIQISSMEVHLRFRTIRVQRRTHLQRRRPPSCPIAPFRIHILDPSPPPTAPLFPLRPRTARGRFNRQHMDLHSPHPLETRRTHQGLSLRVGYRDRDHPTSTTMTALTVTDTQRSTVALKHRTRPLLAPPSAQATIPPPRQPPLSSSLHLPRWKARLISRRTLRHLK